jgi:hypothetical protein
MAGGKTNTTRIEALEELTRDLVSPLNVHDETLKWLSEILRKGAESTEEHSKKIVVFEEKVVVLADFRRCLDTVSAIQQDLVAFRKDLESLQKWKDDQKKEEDETTRRWWSFGPNIAGAIVNVILTAVVAFVVARPSRP